MNKKFKKVLVVLGGKSGERTVSLESGNACIKALKKKGYKVSSFDPKIKWMLPQGAVPFIKNESPAGEEHTILRKEAKKLYHFLQGGDDKLPQFKRENLFIQMLEGLHGDEAELLINAKDKKLHQIYKGLSDAVVKEAFNWDENYLKKT